MVIATRANPIYMSYCPNRLTMSLQADWPVAQLDQSFSVVSGSRRGREHPWGANIETNTCVPSCDLKFGWFDTEWPNLCLDVSIRLLLMPLIETELVLEVYSHGGPLVKVINLSNKIYLIFCFISYRLYYNCSKRAYGHSQTSALQNLQELVRQLNQASVDSIKLECTSDNQLIVGICTPSMKCVLHFCSQAVWRIDVCRFHRYVGQQNCQIFLLMTRSCSWVFRWDVWLSVMKAVALSRQLCHYTWNWFDVMVLMGEGKLELSSKLLMTVMLNAQTCKQCSQVLCCCSAYFMCCWQPGSGYGEQSTASIRMTDLYYLPASKICYSICWCAHISNTVQCTKFQWRWDYILSILSSWCERSTV